MKLGINLTLVIMTSMLCITGLEVFALSKGIDGVLLTGTIGALAAIPAWFITKKVSEKKAQNGK